MKTKHFLAELERYGWRMSRSGGKHVMLENTLITVERPLALRRQDERDIDPVVVSMQAKWAGLLWDRNRQVAKLDPNHAYYSRYRAAGLEA